MKKTIILLLLTLPLTLYSQQVKKKLLEQRVGPIDCYFAYLAEEGKDTTYYVFGGFQNAKYTAITDIGSFFFSDQSSLDEFIADLEKASKFLGEKNDVTFTKKDYTLRVYDFAKGKLYITDEKDKYTTLNAQQVEKLITWLKTVKFPD